jgi:hypothetical protein
MNRTKLSSLVLILSLLGISLVACASGEESEIERLNSGERFSHSDMYITTDNKTGCKYLIYKDVNEGGLTPLLKSDGTPDCGGE